MSTLQLARDALRRLSSKFGTHDDGTPSDWTEWVECREVIAAIDSDNAHPVVGFPTRIMDILMDVARREDTEFQGPWEDGNGEPLQDDADAAIKWIADRSSPQQPAAPEWLPIETAPKDGKESLFFTEELGQVVMYWDGYEGKWETGFNKMSILTPTHWMPIPPAPKAGSGS